MQRFYSQTISQNEPFYLSEEESRHAISVLRHKSGDEINVIDGMGLSVQAEIIAANPKKTLIKFLSKLETKQKPNLLHIAISPTKSNDRIEWFIEKACEIGIGQITPLICQRTERNKINMDRWNKIVISSCKQAQQLYFPIINESITLEKFLNQNIHLNSNLYITSIGSQNQLKNNNITVKTIIMIGPEGDFSENEFDLIRKLGIEEIGLGNSVLRVETAGLVAVSQWNNLR